MINRQEQGALWVLLLLLCAAGSAAAQGTGQKPVRIVVGFIAGGAGDSIARLVAQKMTEVAGRSAYVENRPGASTMIASEFVVKSPPDGNTLMLAGNSAAINVSLQPKIPYDVVRDFAPVILLDYVTNVLVVHPALPVRSVKDLIALAKARPGEINFASSGIGGSVHLAGELFKSMAGINIVHIPYKGFAQLLTDVLSGQVPMAFNVMQNTLPLIKRSQIRALAVTSRRRSEKLPDLPTMSEAALPGYEMVTWHSLLAPAGTPPDVIERINREVNTILKMPDVRQRLDVLGVEVAGSTPAEFGQFLKSEIDKYARLIKSAGTRIE